MGAGANAPAHPALKKLAEHARRSPYPAKRGPVCGVDPRMPYGTACDGSSGRGVGAWLAVLSMLLLSDPADMDTSDTQPASCMSSDAMEEQEEDAGE